METVIARLNKQAAKIQKVDAKLELKTTSPRTVARD
jgi:hypothetical protein